MRNTLGFNQRLRVTVLLCSTLVFAIVMPSGNAPACASNVTVWVTKANGDLLGDCTTYSSKQAYKLVAPRTGLKFVTSAPDWKAYIYNDESKCCFETTLEKSAKNLAGQHSVISSFLAADTVQDGWHFSSETKFMGYRALVYKWLPPKSSSMPQAHSFNTLRSAECWLIPAVDTECDQLHRWRSTLYGYPYKPGAAVKLIHYLDHGKPAHMYQTYSLTKCVMPEQFFTPPAHYRRAHSEMEVIAGDEGRDAILDMTKELGGPLSDSAKTK